MSMPVFSRTLVAVLSVVIALITAALIALPIAVGLGLGLGQIVDTLTQDAFSGVTLPDPLGRWRTLIVLVLGLLPLVALLKALIAMRGLFRNYAEGAVLTHDSAGLIRQTGIWLAITAALSIIVHPVQVLALTLSNPPGERAIAIALSSDQIGFLLTGALLVAIGWAMSDAAEAAEDSRSIV